MYLAAQYLAAAGISFLEKKADDSHTNLEFVTGNASLNSRPLNKAGEILSLNFERFTLEWKRNGSNRAFKLDGNTHGLILQWIREQAGKSGMMQHYNYDFHYDLPYKITDDFTFKLLDANRLSELTHLRILAQLVLEKFLSTNELNSEIRVWPHHFDTGIYTQLDACPNTSIGAGLAIPDNVVNEHYFYLSGYNDNAAISTKDLKALSNGHWHNNGFTGAVLPAKGATLQTGLDFLEEALDILVNNS